MNSGHKTEKILVKDFVNEQNLDLFLILDGWWSCCVACLTHCRSSGSELYHDARSVFMKSLAKSDFSRIKRN